MKRLVAAIYNDVYPFNNLPNTHQFGNVYEPEELTSNDILIVHGGGDISPSLYGKKVSKHTYADDIPSNRDYIEWELMKRAKELDVPIIGICRGAQMLCALAGGYLIQHIEGHGGNHLVKTYDNKYFKTNSIHHQMMYPWVNGVEFDLLAWSKVPLSSVYYDEDEQVEVPVEPEYIYFPELRGFAVQWHPEMMQEDTDATSYVLDHIKKVLGL